MAKIMREHIKKEIVSIVGRILAGLIIALIVKELFTK
jgi:hypothetical protein